MINHNNQEISNLSHNGGVKSVYQNNGLIYPHRNANSAYFTINQNLTDPSTMITDYSSDDLINYIRSKSHRYIGKFTNNTMYICQLDDSDNLLFHDGSSASFYISSYDVFVKIQPFYVKPVELEADIWKINYSLNKEDDDYVQFFHNQLIGAYKSYCTGSSVGKMYSYYGKTPSYNVSKDNLSERAKRRGENFHLVTWEQHCGVALLYYATYKNMNSQAVIGSGVDSRNKTTGATISIGMNDTVAGGNGDSIGTNFFGLENWIGDLYEFVDNVKTTTYGHWDIYDPVTGTVYRSIDFTPPRKDTDFYPTKMLIGKYFDLIATSAGGTAKKGYCDYACFRENAVVIRSGDAKSDVGGVSYQTASSGDAYEYSGTRLSYTGNFIEIEDPAEFLAL